LTNLATLSVAVVISCAATACAPAELPDPESPVYAETVAAFWRGLAAAEVGETSLAAASFARVTELAPGEPAGWADLAVVELQRQEVEAAAGSLARALSLAPEDGQLRVLAAVVERERGDLDSAAAHLQQAVTLPTPEPRALYLLAEILMERDSRRAADAGQLLDRLLATRPGNLVALLERARLAAGQGDSAALRYALDRIAGRADSLSVPQEADVRGVRTDAEAGAFDRATTRLSYIEGALQSLPAYQADAAAVRTSPTRLDLLLSRFLRLPIPAAGSAPADTSLAFAAESLAIGEGPVGWVRAVWLSEEFPLGLATAARGAVWVSPAPGVQVAIPSPVGSADDLLPPTALAPLDYDYDFRVDLALAGPGGLRLFRQETDGSFTDVTRTAIPGAARSGRFAGVWAADLDLEGDLDLVLAGAEGPSIALQNRGDGTFGAYPDFPAVGQLRDFVWADLDADGDPDLVALDAAGRLAAFANRRSQTPQFTPFPLPRTVGTVRAMVAADLDHDATLELILLQADGAVRRLSLTERGWATDDVTRWPNFSADGVPGAGLFVEDLDNSGALDLVAVSPAGTRVWLAGAGRLLALPMLRTPVTGLADVSGDGRLDLLGAAPDGQPQLLVAQATTRYYSTTIRPRAAEATGDRRINSFGIGGEIEVRGGLVYQKQVIRQPAVHFGLGEQPRVDVTRLIWPNGSVQAEFNQAATNETILTIQRLKGSCPWVFTFDGSGMRFVTDFLWRTALGLRINAQGNAAVIHSEDWIRVRGDQLAARDGFYDVRITADLWETHFFDHVGLMVVDHPEGTEVFVDERFALPAPTPALHVTRPARSVAWARDQDDRDVTDLVRARDGRYVDTFERGPFQGVATDHYLEIVLGDSAPTAGPLWLVAHGWVYPTDASINVAISQGTHVPPGTLRLEIPDGAGGWRTVEPNLGFPAGKSKTMLIDLQRVFPPDADRRLRLRTNLEVYWDHVAWAVGLPDAPAVTQRLLPATAELRYRGFSRVSQASRTVPELPDYEPVTAAAPQWRDLVGFYTRFGDVRPLTEAADDRYVIMNAGDELAFRFAAPAPPPAGWTRDFVLIGDGWVKDGDFNTGFSATVLPLPYHGLVDYTRPPGSLADDPGYQRHPEDWLVFHTRYVTTQRFHRALVPSRSP
jgi:Tfp pilus assembly protein PilF